MRDYPRNIVFFDGVCGFCNEAVDVLIRLDDDAVLKFAPIQGETANDLLPEKRRENVDTICFWNGERLFVRTRALLEILKTIGGFWIVFYPLVLMPDSWRDVVYNWVAARRYQWFGKRETCRMPEPEERELFLD